VLELRQFDGLLVKGRGAFGVRTLIVAISIPGLWTGCTKRPMADEDAGPPAPPATSTPTVTELLPLTMDAGDDADASADAAEASTSVPRRWTGPALSPNQAKIKACCSAMRAQSRVLGLSSPEGYQLNTLSIQCDAFVAQIGPQGTAPELSQFREVLKNIQLPSACQP
jgi:hypothetical protein